MLAASISNSLDSGWLRFEPIRVGRVPAALSTLDRFVTVVRDNQPLLRIDVYAYRPDYFPFEDVIFWRDLVIIGFGSRVHVVSTTDHSVVTVELGSYFGHFYPEQDFVLLASAEHLFRLQPDRSLGWKSDHLGIDGVIVREVGSDVVRGDGEWDPPGGWKSFSVSVTDGKLVA